MEGGATVRMAVGSTVRLLLRDRDCNRRLGGDFECNRLDYNKYDDFKHTPPGIGMLWL